METSSQGNNITTCRRCNHESSTKSNLLSHLRRKISCDIVNENISIEDYIEELLKKEYNEKTYDCEFCNMKFNSRSSKSRHRKTCNKKKEKEDKEQKEKVSNVVLEYINTLQEQNTQLTQRLDEMEKIVSLSNKAVVNQNNNITNNITNNIYNINLKNFGYEDTSYLTHEFLSYCLLNPKKGLTTLIENIHYNKEHPNNQNIRCKSLKQNIFEKYVDSEWRACDASNTLDELIRKGYRILNTHYNDNFMNDPEIFEDEYKQKAYEKFRFLSDTNCNDYFAVKRELRLLVKDRTIYILESPDDVVAI
jgi:hypothetical protein